MNTDATNRDVWPGILRAPLYGLTRYDPPLAHVDWAFITIDDPNPPVTRREYLLAIRAALASNVDIAEELGLVHPDPVVRQYLQAVEARLSKSLGE